MNFRLEARYCDIFRRRAAKRNDGVTSPQVFFKYCTEEVLVSEFVSGVWMWELMAAVEANDQEFLSRLKAQGIEPKSLAQKFVVVMHREVQEELFFHADPHPANIVILPNNTILSENVAELSIYKRETGHVRDSYRRGWLMEFWDAVAPF